MNWLEIKSSIICMILTIALIWGCFVNIIPAIEIGGQIYQLIEYLLLILVPIIGFLLPLDFFVISIRNNILSRIFGVMPSMYFAALKNLVGAMIILLLAMPVFFSFPNDTILNLGSGILIITGIITLLRDPLNIIGFAV